MGRILLAWELGLNLGHLARLLPIAVGLRSRGHAALVAARDLTSAARVLAPEGVSFIQAPYLADGHPLPHRPAGYSDILRAQGWGDRATLRGLTEGWINLYRMFRPELVVADYSPTAVWAAHLVNIPYLLIGNGFEVPPDSQPIPPFPGFSWATAAQAAASEALVLENAKRVGGAFRGRTLECLSELVAPERALFATFAELDHYGARDRGRYIGPLLAKLGSQGVPWPEEELRARKVFVCVRPDTANREALLGALRSLDASVICVALGFQATQLEAYRAPNINFSLQPLDLAPLVGAADVCLSYGAEGTVASFLLGGVPQVLAPHQVEAHLAARRIEALGAGVVLRGAHTPETVVEAVQSVLTREEFTVAAEKFAGRRGGEAGEAVANAVAAIEGTVGRTTEVAVATPRPRPSTCSDSSSGSLRATVS
jgi:UDP:flavonoid glycosyltransferase YjiC (YdhE family)